MKKLLIPLIALLVVVGGGTAAWTMLHKPARAATAPHTAPAHPDVSTLLSLPDTTINLRGDDGFSYLRIQISVLVKGPGTDEALKAAVEAHTSALRDALIATVEGQAFTTLRTPEGRRDLEAGLRSRFDQILAPAHADTVYFEEFVAE
jgi:flagellar basal body-associated protein FliL